MDFNYINESAGSCLISGTQADSGKAGTAGCGKAKTAVLLTVTPSPGFVEVGGKWPFKAHVFYSDGTVLDVTEDALWSAYNTNVATIAATGIATGMEVGITTITAVYGDLRTTGELEVAALCIDDPMDVVLVLDRSASMNAVDAEGKTRIDRAREAAKIFIDNLESEEDQIAIVSFAGLWVKGDTVGTPLVSEGDATIEQTMTADKSTAKTAVDNYGLEGACLLGSDTDNPTGTNCSIGLGTALQVARTEVNSTRHKAGHKRVVVLLTDGINAVSLPDPIEIATQIKGSGAQIVVIGLDVPTYSATLTEIASEGLFYPSPSTYQLAGLIAELPHSICYGHYGLVYYSGPYTYPTVFPPVVQDSSTVIPCPGGWVNGYIWAPADGNGTSRNARYPSSSNFYQPDGITVADPFDLFLEELVAFWMGKTYAAFSEWATANLGYVPHVRWYWEWAAGGQGWSILNLVDDHYLLYQGAGWELNLAYCLK